MTDVSLSRARVRKLIHWINSLPLASCLLVDTLEELRLGDVLSSVVRWIQGDSIGDPDPSDDELTASARDRVAFVVDYVAQRCSAADGDALFQVNSAECAARVVDGDVVAIAAVVSVLRRLVMDKDAATRATATEQAQHVRHHVQRAVEQRVTGQAGTVVQSGTETDEAVKQKEDISTKRPQRRSSLRRLSMAKSPHTIDIPSVSRPLEPATASSGPTRLSRIQKENELLPNGKADQPPATGSTVKRRSLTSTRKTMAMVASQDQADGLLEWMGSLGVFPGHSAGKIARSTGLQDGVALCGLAAFVARRRGSITIRHKLHTTTASPGSTSVLFPRGASMQPRTKAERRHNLATAFSLLNECCVLPTSAAELTPDKLVELVDGSTVDDGVTIWSILAHVQSQLQQPPPSVCSKRPALASTPDTSSIVDDAVVRRRPYTTTEQIDVVKRWMKDLGVDPAAVSSGIFEDCLRNGVGLCQVLCKTRPGNITRLSYKDPPKTLVEVRTNIHLALAAMASLSEPRIPTVYLTKQAVDGIAMGDKQYVFGLLWHLMQFCKDQDARASQSEAAPKVSETMRVASVNSVRAATPPPNRSPKLNKTVTTATNLTGEHTKPRVTSLLLDVPAYQLVEEELRADGELTTLVGSRCVPWEAASLMDGIDDIVPSREDAKPMEMAELGEPHNDIVPAHRSQQQCQWPQPRRTTHSLLEDDIVPRRASLANQSVVKKACTRTQELDQDPRMSNVTSENGRGSILETKANTTRPPAAETDAPPPPPNQTVEYSAAQVAQLLRWLEQLGVELTDVDAFQNLAARLREFSSGVVLCSIVEKLEHMRSMEGVCRDEPIARAHALHNIEKALDVLRRKKTLPISLLRRKLQIYEGDRGTVLGLLWHMRKAYGHHRRVKQPKVPQDLGRTALIDPPVPLSPA